MFGCEHMFIGAHRGWNRTLNHLELELQVVLELEQELSSCSLQEQQVLLIVTAPLQSLKQIFDFEFFKKIFELA